MQQLSYNQLNNKRLSSVNLFKPVLVILLIGSVYAAGYFTPIVTNNIKYSSAKSVSTEFIQELTAGELDKALALSTDEMRSQYPTADTLHEAIGNVKSDTIIVQKAEGAGRENIYQYRQLVEGLPANPAGLTDGMFEVTALNTNGKWQVASIKLL